MIVKMVKAFVVARSGDRNRLLESLRVLGAVHLEPVDPASAVADEETLSAIDRLDRAVQILSVVEPDVKRADAGALDAAAEALRIHRESLERRARLATLHQKMHQMEMWGDVRLEQLLEIERAGVRLRFVILPEHDAAEVRAECAHVLRRLQGGRLLLAVVSREGEARLPESAEEVSPPAQDRPSIRAEAGAIDESLVKDNERLRQLAHCVPAMLAERSRLRGKAQWTVASRGALADADLFAIQGWIPQEQSISLADRLAGAGLASAVRLRRPSDDELPPTLIRYPRWVRPIHGVFNVLGIVPGYREFDVSWAFMIGLPVFAAMLIGDGGYGLLFLLLPLIFYRKVAGAIGAELAQLAMVFGFLAIIWGVVTASFFGVDGATMIAAGGVWEPLGRALGRLQLVTVGLEDNARNRLMRIAFTIGAIHLSFAHLWRARAAFPKASMLASVGWATFLWGMYGIVKRLVLNEPPEWSMMASTPYYYLLVAGAFLVLFFTRPSWNPLKALLSGLAAFPLSAIGTFSDIMSYVRLMAIGLAGSVLAVKFNEMAAAAGWVGAIPILLLGHALNIALCLIALFAHGVRLNILEFSNNLGMEWSGYPYEPFSVKPQEN